MKSLLEGQDVMQVCCNGHVITDLLHNFPERSLSHCDRCGAATLESCSTCGQELPGAFHVPGMVPIGRPQPPEYCLGCGAPFPWTRKKESPSSPEVLDYLQTLLRRLPRVVRQLRVRQGDRPPFRVEDERDLEDLVRALLPLHCDDIRPETRTPKYAASTRTDFRLEPGGLVVTVKRASAGIGDKQLALQLQEDAEYYEREEKYNMLVCLVYDPEALLPDPGLLEQVWSRSQGRLQVLSVVAR